MLTTTRPCRAANPATCRKHGVAGSVQAQLKEAKAELKKKQDVHELHKLLGRSVRRGINASEHSEELVALDKQADEFEARLSKDEENAIGTYRMGAYDYTNRYLRCGREGVADYIRHDYRREPTEEQIDQYVQYCQQNIAGLDSAFTKTTLPEEPRMLYKAFRVSMSDNAKTTPEDLKKYVEEHYPVGKVLTNKAYTSTSVDSDYMLAFAKKDSHQVIVHEIVSKKGIPLHESSWRQGGSIQDAEREVLLPRDLKLRVAAIKEVTYESTYPQGRPLGSSFYATAPKRKRYLVVQLVAED